MTSHTIDELDLHGERAALRGNPSFVWRAGQDRRLNMILHWAPPTAETNLKIAYPIFEMELYTNISLDILEY